MQQINFLKSLPKDNKQLPALWILWIVLGVFLLLVLISILIGVNQHHLQQKLILVEQQLQLSKKEYNNIIKGYPLLASDMPLIDQVKNLEQAYQTKKEEFDTLERLFVRKGFAPYLYGLAEQTPNSLWLNEIHIDHSAKNINFRGFAQRPDAVSDLIGRILTLPTFKATTFNLFYVKTIKNRPYVKFSIATKDLGVEVEEVVPEPAAPVQKVKEK